MASVELTGLAGEVERLLRLGSARLAERLEAEYTATTEDELVTAITSAEGSKVDIHPLAKRRLDREDLAAAVVQAVNQAEGQATATADTFLDDLDLGGTGVSEETRQRVSAEMRAQLERLPFRF